MNHVSGSNRLGHLLILGCTVLGMVCIQVLWDLRTQLITQLTLFTVLRALLAISGLFLSVIVVGAFMYQLDKAAGRIKKPNRFFERIFGDGEKS